MNLKTFKNSLFDKRWAFAAIIIGIVAGFISVVICVYGHLVIFGFNIAFIVSPLTAGLVETIIARRMYGRSTGAISAIIIFFIINIVAWVFPKEPISLSIFTLGGLALAVQAAFPILINYLLFVVFIGALTYLFGFIGNLISKALEKIYPSKFSRKSSGEESETIMSLLPEDMILPALTISGVPGKKIAEHLGLVIGEALTESKSKKSKSKAVSSKFNINEIEEAKVKALKDLMKKADELGASTVLDVVINYNTIGGLTGGGVMVTAVGTAVKYEN